MFKEIFESSPRRSLATGIGFCATVILLALHASYFDFLNDDAFISFRYSYNLAHHGELVFNLGDPVEGYTNFLWTVLMALVIWLDGDPAEWSKLLGIACSALTLLAVFAFALKMRVRKQDGPIGFWDLSSTLIAPFLLAATSTFACWSEGGLETALFTLLLTAGLLLYLDEELDGRFMPVSALFLAAAALTRPEGVLVFGLVAAHMIVRDWVVNRRLLLECRRWWFIGVFVVIYLPYWLWRYAYYGYPFPNTYYLKGSEPLWRAGFRYLDTFWDQVPAWLALVALVVPSRFGQYKRQLLTLAGIVCIPYIVHVVRVGGDFMALHRFFMPLLPVLYLVFQEAFHDLLVLVFRNKQRHLAAHIATALVTLSLFAGFLNHSRGLDEEVLEIWSKDGIDSIGWLKRFVARCSAIGIYLQKNYPDGTSIAVTAAGAIPYYSRFTAYDFLGLNDEYIAHNVEHTLGRPGHRVIAPSSFIESWEADLVIYHPVVTRRKIGPRPRLDEPMSEWGYRSVSVRVPNLEPPIWSFYIKEAYAEKLPPELLKSADAPSDQARSRKKGK